MLSNKTSCISKTILIFIVTFIAKTVFYLLTIKINKLYSLEFCIQKLMQLSFFCLLKTKKF